MWSPSSSKAEVRLVTSLVPNHSLKACLMYLFKGGGMLATAKTESNVSLGEHMIIAGLFVLVLSFGLSVVFHRRMVLSPLYYVAKTNVPWTRYMKVLYTASALIMIRSIYRVIEYVQGSPGYFQRDEAYIYVFDATLMLICCLLFNLFHPSGILSTSHEAVQNDDLEMDGHGYR